MDRIFGRVEVMEINDEITLDLMINCGRCKEYKKFVDEMKKKVNEATTKEEKEQIIKEECKNHILTRYKLSSDIRERLVERLIEIENKLIVDKSDFWVWEYEEEREVINHILKFSI